MFVIKVIDKILNKIKEFYLMRVCIKFGGNLMGIWVGFWVEGIERHLSEWSVHPHECGRGGGSPMAGRMAPWVPPSPYKRSPPPSLSLTPPREGSLSPSRIYPPWSRTSEIHVPGGYSARKSCASAASLERGGGGCSVPRTCVRARMRCWFAALGLPLDLEIGKRSSTSTTSWTR